MNRFALVNLLERAESYVTEGEIQVQSQRRAVDSMERDGQDATAARKLLAWFERLQQWHIEDRDRIRTKLQDGER